MNNPTTTPNQDVPTPEGSTGSQAQSTTAPAAPAELAALANGETRDIRLRSLDIQALLTLDKDIESSVPDTIRQGIASYFDRYCIEIFVELPDEVVKLRLYGALGEWDGHSVRYRVDVSVKRERVLLSHVLCWSRAANLRVQNRHVRGGHRVAQGRGARTGVHNTRLAGFGSRYLVAMGDQPGG